MKTIESRSPDTRLLDRFYGTFAAVVLFFLVIGVPFFFYRKVAASVICGLVLAVLSGVWWISHQGRPRLSIQIFAGLLLTLLATMSLLGLSPATASTALATSVMLTIIAGRRSGFVFAAGYMFGWLTVIVLRQQGILADPFFIERPLVTWIIGAMGMWLVLLPIPDMVRTIRQSNAYHRRLIEANLDPLIIADATGRITDCNAAACKLTGLEKSQLLGQHFAQQFEQSAALLKALQPVFDGHAVRDQEAVLQHRDGRATPVLCNGYALLGRDGRAEGVVVSARDLSERKRLEAELRELAATDFLTGVCSRRQFMTQLQGEFDRAQRHPEQAACVLMLDIDHFKRINDQFGHAAGDEALRRFAAVLRDEARKSDVVGRLGGEEFGLLLPSTDVEAAMVLAQRLLQRVASMDGGLPGLLLTTSIGVARLNAADASADAAVIRADRALYAAKSAGRNRVELAESQAIAPQSPVELHQTESRHWLN